MKTYFWLLLAAVLASCSSPPLKPDISLNEPDYLLVVLPHNDGTGELLTLDAVWVSDLMSHGAKVTVVNQRLSLGDTQYPMTPILWATPNSDSTIPLPCQAELRKHYRIPLLTLTKHYAKFMAATPEYLEQYRAHGLDTSEKTLIIVGKTGTCEVQITVLDARELAE